MTHSSLKIAMYTFNEIRYNIYEQKLKYYLKNNEFRGKNLYQCAFHNSKLPQMASWVKNLMMRHT